MGTQDGWKEGYMNGWMMDERKDGWMNGWISNGGMGVGGVD